jgi:uncharacterized protein (DUF2336 family)
MMSATILTPGVGSAKSPPPDPSDATRVRLSSNQTTPPSVLHALARDPNVTVRAAVAMNPACPRQTEQQLAADPDERVRALLARRLAGLIPMLEPAEREQLAQHANSTLARLVEDEAVRVRAAIADVVKNMPEAPRELILRLAHDTAVNVSEPVIRLSPQLTDADLLALLSDAPTAATATMVARRAGLSETLSDAIAASADDTAITALLQNPSAAIREQTLDSLIARAAAHVEWHEPLVRRPHLSARAARALADIVADNLLEVLSRRADLPPAVLGELRWRLIGRLGMAVKPTEDPSPEDALAEAYAMLAEQRLTEEALLTAAQQGNRNRCAAMLAVAAGVPLTSVNRAALLRSARGIVSLLWKAGFSMRVAAPVQMLLARLPPNAVLNRRNANDFPLGVAEMRWQIDFLGRTPI